MSWHWRWMVRRDVPAVLGIEAATPDPWAEADLMARLRARTCIGMVAADGDGAVAGYVVYALHRKTVEVLRLAVAPAHRRRGVGTYLLRRVAAKLRTYGRTGLGAEVPEGALDVQLLFRACGVPAVDVADGRVVFHVSLQLAPPALVAAGAGGVL